MKHALMACAIAVMLTAGVLHARANSPPHTGTTVSAAVVAAPTIPANYSQVPVPFQQATYFGRIITTPTESPPIAATTELCIYEEWFAGNIGMVARAATYNRQQDATASALIRLMDGAHAHQYARARSGPMI